MSRTTERSDTPWASLLVYMVLALGLAYVFGWNTDPVKFFGEIATLGTILIALTYLAANGALPVYYRRFHAAEFSPSTHLLLPLVGALAIGYPLYELVKPGSRTRSTATPTSLSACWRLRRSTARFSTAATARSASASAR